MERIRKVSIEDVAQRAQVSISTVSRVINKLPTVSKKNQARVEEAVAFLKYEPDVSAQRLASGRNMAVGLVMPGYPGIFHSFYAIEIIRGVGHACETLRLDMLFHITNGANPLNSRSAGGIVFADIIENRAQVESALRSGIPCLVINKVVTDLDVHYIAVDNLLGGETATDYLVNLGHRKIATITGSLQTQSGQQRHKGYRSILEKNKIPLRPEYVIEGDYSRRSARQGMEKLLALSERPTAVFIASDDMAMEAIAVIIENGLKVPDDISIVGFDDNASALYGPIALTTIRQPLFQMGEEAVKYLYNIMTGKKKSLVQKVLPPQLVVRDSCVAPRKNS